MLQAVTVVGAGLPANTGVAGAMHRVAWFASKLAPTGVAGCNRVGAGLPANTGVAGAMHRVAWFASKAGSYRCCGP
ncbi:hypothetical protein E3U47_05680 [Pseudomonas sp. RIT623]|nr:hypothetical protein E3U47_05680 [Pseudomonas sp. RIT623]